ncbi:MAG: NACHT domain-containing protein, partial [Anaerolineales bacterium]
MNIGKAAAGAGAWAWKEYGKDITGGFIEFLKRKARDAKIEHAELLYAQDRWVDFNWGQAAKRYRERMRESYGRIHVLGAAEPVGLDDVFTDVFILEKPLAFHRFDMARLHKLQHEPGKLRDAKRIAGLRVVVQPRGHRLFLLGKPGAGKTTFLKYLVHRSTQAEWDKIPVFVTLKDWADSGLGVMAFITSQFEICNFPHARPFVEYTLETGRAVLLFDGLDEVRQEGGQRDRTITALHDFCKTHHRTQAVITCRVAASDYAFTEFTYIEMADFNEAQVKTYARKWFGPDTALAAQFLAELAKPENKGVADLGRSPLLLSLVCLTYNETLHIPQRRVELYEEALDALLKKWDASRKIRRDEIYQKLSLGRKRQMFARLAAESFEKGEIFFPQKRLARKIEAYLKNLPPADAGAAPDGEDVLQAIENRHGIFVQRARGLYTFAHLTFQEYYTARYIADNAHRGTLPRLMAHLTGDRWREVFLLTASLLDEAGDFFRVMHRAIDDLIRPDDTLMNVQRWVECKAAEIDGFQPGAVRSVYWFLALDRALALDLARARALALDRALALAL